MEQKIINLVHEYIYEDILSVANANLPWEKLKDSTILITGAAGFIGYYLTMAMLIRNDLYNDNIKVLALVRNRQKSEKRFGDALKRDDIELIVQDVCDDIKTDEKADYIIHAASQASAYFFENDPVGTIDANLTGLSLFLIIVMLISLEVY